MKIEQQVVSLELAQKMNELGFKQESLFWWKKFMLPYQGGESRPNWVLRREDEIWDSGHEYVLAYTVAELEIYLPTNVVCQNTSFGEVLVKLLDEEGETIYFTREENGADARAKMLCYLVENKLILEPDIASRNETLEEVLTIISE